MGHISKIGLPGSCYCQKTKKLKKKKNVLFFYFSYLSPRLAWVLLLPTRGEKCLRTKTYFCLEKNTPGNLQIYRYILWMWSCVLEQALGIMLGVVCCGAGIDQEYCEAYSQHAIYSFAKVTAAITSIDVVRISFAFRRYLLLADVSLYQFQ